MRRDNHDVIVLEGLPTVRYLNTGQGRPARQYERESSALSGGQDPYDPMIDIIRRGCMCRRQSGRYPVLPTQHFRRRCNVPYSHATSDRSV